MPWKLVPCLHPGTLVLPDLYVNNHTNPAYDFNTAGYSNNYVVKLTLPSSLTGLTYDITTCVVLFNVASGSYPNYDLGVVENFGLFQCFTCMDQFNISTCDTPTTTYSIGTSDKTVTQSFIDCASECNGCQPSLNLILPGNPNPPVPQGGCYTPGVSTGEPINIDLYDPTFILGCNPNPCLACTEFCYQVQFCDLSPFIIISNSFTTVIGAPSITAILNQPIKANIRITPVGGTEYGYNNACVQIQQLPNCNPIGNTYPIFEPTEIELLSTLGEYVKCEDCTTIPDFGYYLRRCDDPGITISVSTDMAGVIGSVITGVKVLNCSSTVDICSSVRPEQCWEVLTTNVPGQYQIEYTSILPNCSCCSGPCE